jgi:hypothetical protein
MMKQKVVYQDFNDTRMFSFEFVGNISLGNGMHLGIRNKTANCINSSSKNLGIFNSQLK